MALQKKITFKKINDSFSNCKKDDGNVAPKKPKLNEEGAEKKPEDEKTEECEDIRSSYLLTMSQSSGGSKEDYVFEPHEEVGTIDSCVSALSKLLHFQLENMNLTQICQSLTAPTILIQTFKGTKDVVNLQRSLEELQPSFIVMYHSNLTAIREIEMYEAHRKRDTPMKVYFLIHAGTVEEQSYLTSMRREKEAFEFLIQTKSVHSLPISLPITREHFLVDHGRPRRPRRQIRHLREPPTRPQVPHQEHAPGGPRRGLHSQIRDSGHERVPERAAGSHPQKGRRHRAGHDCGWGLHPDAGNLRREEEPVGLGGVAQQRQDVPTVHPNVPILRQAYALDRIRSEQAVFVAEPVHGVHGQQQLRHPEKAVTVDVAFSQIENRLEPQSLRFGTTVRGVEGESTARGGFGTNVVSL
jgi:hypothetical protein